MINPKLDDLIARIEAATGPDRALDAEIACYLKIVPDPAPGWLKRWSGPFAPISFRGSDPGQIAAMHSDGKSGVNWTSPRFTASLDAAITLVPQGSFWSLLTSGDNDHGYQAAVVPFRRDIPRELTYTSCETPALALCAAALKARNI